MPLSRRRRNMHSPVLTLEEQSNIENGSWFSKLSPALREAILARASVRRLHDGAMLAAFEYDGLDKDSTDEDQLDAASASFEMALSAFDHRNTLWTFLDKRRRVFIKDSDIGHPVGRRRSCPNAARRRPSQPRDRAPLRWREHAL